MEEKFKQSICVSPEDFKCENCGKEDCGILFAATKNRDRSGEDFFVCEDCFRKLEGIGFEDYRLGVM